MKKKSLIKKIISKIFNIYKADGELIFVILGIKIKFQSPAQDRLRELCVISNLDELIEKKYIFPPPDRNSYKRKSKNRI